MKRVLLMALALIVSVSLWAGTPLKSYEEEYYSFLTLMGKSDKSYIMYRSIANNRYSNIDGFWNDSNLTRTRDGLTIYGPDVLLSYNTQRPWGQNDGSLWQGVGFNAKARMGFSYSKGFFSIHLRPEVDFSQNADYPTMHNTFRYYWDNFDKPQRFGPSSFFAFSPGDAEGRLTFGSFTVGVGYSELWTGPTYLNSILHSNNAPTYPRIDIGFDNLKINIPWTSIPLGTFEIHYNLGILKNSDYANYSSGENSLFHLLSMSWRPSFFENLTLGFIGVGHTECSWEKLRTFYRSIWDNMSGIGKEDLKMSLSFEFLFPEVGFEVYGEIGIDDHFLFMVNPFHTMVWQFGLRKGFVLNESEDLYLQFICEFGNMTMSHDAFINWPLNFYTHSNTAVASYSNMGQLLGAGTGWAGNSQYVAFQLYHRKGMACVFFQRSNPDNNYILAQVANTGKIWPQGDPFYCFKGLLDFGVRTVYHLADGISVSASAVYELIANDHYREDEFVTEDMLYPWLSNWHFDVGFVVYL